MNFSHVARKFEDVLFGFGYSPVPPRPPSVSAPPRTPLHAASPTPPLPPRSPPNAPQSPASPAAARRDPPPIHAYTPACTLPLALTSRTSLLHGGSYIGRLCFLIYIGNLCMQAAIGKNKRLKRQGLWTLGLLDLSDGTLDAGLWTGLGTRGLG